MAAIFVEEDGFSVEFVQAVAFGAAGGGGADGGVGEAGLVVPLEGRGCAHGGLNRGSPLLQAERAAAPNVRE